MSITASEATAVLEGSFTQNCAHIAGAALIFFDHVITFGQEVQLFWGERSLSALLFFANRTFALSNAAISVWSVMNFDTVTSCMAYVVTSNLLSILIGIISEVATILRIYAVTGGNRWPVMFLTLFMVFRLAVAIYAGFTHLSYSVLVLNGTAVCTLSETSGSTQGIIKLIIVNMVCNTIAVIVMLAILWRKLYVHHRLAIVDILSTSNPSLAATLMRDGTIQLTAVLLFNLLSTVLTFVDINAEQIINDLNISVTPVMISHVFLNVRAAARSTRGEQSQTPSFVKSRRALQTQADVENMSFELNILSSTEQAQETDRAHLQESMENNQGVAEPCSRVNDVAIVGDAHQDVNEEEGVDEVEEEML